MGKVIGLSTEVYELVTKYADESQLSMTEAANKLINLGLHSGNTPTQTTETVVEKVVEQYYLCEKCKHTFKTDNELIKHRRDNHRIDLMYVSRCHYCDEESSTLQGIIDHERTQHAAQYSQTHLDAATVKRLNEEYEQTHRIKQATKDNTQGMIKSGYIDYDCDRCDFHGSEESIIDHYAEIHKMSIPESLVSAITKAKGVR